jgi:hypothetical protein
MQDGWMDEWMDDVWTGEKKTFFSLYSCSIANPTAWLALYGKTIRIYLPTL